MTAYAVNVLVPVPITDAMLTSSTIAEPAAGETAWVSGGTFVAGDLRIRTTTHRVYKCVQDHTGRTALPEVDTAYWLDAYATQKWAMFDGYASTQSTITTPLITVLRPGFINGAALLNIDGETLNLSYKDAAGGVVVDTRTISLQEDPIDWYDWAFGQIKTKSKVIIENLMPYPDPELTITITASTGVTVKCGMLALGDMRNLLDGAEFGGTQYGAKVQPTTFSYIKTDEFGNTVIKQRGSATDFSIDVILPKGNNDLALIALQDVLDVPAVWTASTMAGYAGLTVFGLASGALTYEGFSYSKFSISVKGMM